MIRTALTVLILTVLGSGTAWAERDVSFRPSDDIAHERNQDQLVLEGYSPVSYFEHGHPEKGDPRFSSTYQGNRYYFTDAQQKRKFDRNPEKYAPRFPRNCPYNLAKGREVPVDPLNYKIVGGELLLFHKSPAQDGRKLWNREIKRDGISESEMLERAENNLMNMEF